MGVMTQMGGVPVRCNSYSILGGYTMKWILVLACAILMACSLSAAPAVADTGPTLSVNPSLNRAFLVLDNGRTVTMDAATRTFTLRTAQGQTATVSFAQVAQFETSIPAEQQALVDEWIALVTDSGNEFTLTDSHQPTLAVSEPGLPGPPGYVDPYSLPGDGPILMREPGGSINGATQSTPGDPEENDCLLVPCGCRFGNCWPGHGYPFGMGMIYYSEDGSGGLGEKSEARQLCEADHREAWIAARASYCTNQSLWGWTAAIAGGRAAATCSAAAISSGAALAPCALEMAAFGAAAAHWVEARRMCTTTYPGSGLACAGL